jgi:hypothetical protein
MMGDDYHRYPEETVKFDNFEAVFGVTKAVKEFSILRGLSVNLNYLADWHYRYDKDGEITKITARNWVICKPIV